MTDREMWDNAVAVLRGEFEALSDPVRARLRELLDMIRLEKAELCSLPDGKGASLACSGCGGECCRTGKYHFTAIDLLVFLDTGRALFTPSFGGSSCPYLGEGGCLMEPSYRPFTCVTFLCERLEALLSTSDAERLFRLERSLRGHYGNIEELFGNRLTQGLLLSFGRCMDGRSAGILRAEQ